MSEGTLLDSGDLPERLRAGAPSLLTAAEANFIPNGGFYGQVMAFEAQLLRNALGLPCRSVSELAEKLGMDRSHLYTKLKQHGLKFERK